MNRTEPPVTRRALLAKSDAITKLEELLWFSVKIRVKHISNGLSSNENSLNRVAILFSGGVDCTLIARIVDDILDRDQIVDLLNVAFQNPRIHGLANQNENANGPVYETCPDRITGRKALAELRRICTGRRWRFVEINVPYSETQAHKTTVMSLMHPQKTEMDLSIANALYFAARGTGVVRDEENHGDVEPYSAPARILLSGLGADEVFGGYQRHATAYNRSGFEGLFSELELDISRLGKRNLGRDDRVTSHWGREVRYPFLDEKFLAWALASPVWEKMGFGEETLPNDDLQTEKQDENGYGSIEPGKKALRLLAMKLGMKEAAMAKKRAVSFANSFMISGKTFHYLGVDWAS